MKAIFASFLQLVCLVGMMHFHLLPAQVASLVLINSTEGRAPTPLPSCCSHDEYACCQLRRGGGGCVQVASRRIEAFSKDVSVPPCTVVSSIPLAGDAFLLAQRWQFLERAAVPPRAPSFLV